MTAPNRLLLLVVMFLAALAACGDDAKTPVDTPTGSTAKEITAFSFKAAQNPALTSDVAATINGDAIALTLPTGTNVTALVATFNTTGASVTVGGTAQTSGSTPNNFTSPVVYRVTSQSGATRDYTVTITVAASTSKAITAFSFTMAANPSLTADVPGAINGTNISATVPFGTNVTALVATFTSTGQSVMVAATNQVSGTTPNNFSAPVTYVVRAGDGTIANYTVSVTVAQNTAKSITAFSFRSAQNPGLAADVTATINGNNIDAAMSFGTNVSALVATFTSTGQLTSVLGAPQTSGTTANNFNAPVVYHVTAADGTTRDYTVTVTVAQNPAKDLTAFLFRSAQNPGLLSNVTGVINGTAISVVMPFGTAVTNLIAQFSTTGQMVTVGGTVQNSGITANNFGSPVVYRVTAANGSTKDYTVTVTVASGTAKDITSFVFHSADNPSLSADVIGVINGTAISAVLPFGSTVGTLVATYQTTGVQVTVGGIDQNSGVSSNDFSSPVLYHVRAVDNSTQDYTVTVTVAANPAKDLTAFSFLMANNAGLTADATGSIAGTSITVVLPFGASASSLVASFTTTGASVSIGGVTQVSGTTANDFTNPVVYRVTAADGSTKDFTVTVGIGNNPAKDITTFAFLAANNPGLGSDVTATINGTAITATIPFGPDVTKLVASFSTTGTSVTVGGVTQASGATQNDFTSPVVYRVTALDMSTKDYTVTLAVTCEPLTAPMNGTVATTNGGISPSTATYSCNPGLAVDASATRTCSAAGLWSGTAPTCQLGIMVVRVGDGTAAPSNASTAVFIEEHAMTNGFLARTITLPAATVGLQAAFTLSGTANTEGMLARSVDGTAVSLAGYATAPGVAAISSTPNVTTNVASINRVVAYVTTSGTVDTSTLLTNAFNGSSPRGAVGNSKFAFWVTGAAGSAAGPGGVHYVAAGSSGMTTRVITPVDTTTSYGHIADGQLYASTSTAVAAVGTGTPTSIANPLTPLAAAANIRSFAVFDRNPVVAGPDTIYVAMSAAVSGGSNTINVAKFTYNGTAWTQSTFAPMLSGVNAGALGLAAWVEGNNIRLVTTQNVGNNSANRLVTFVDDGVATAPATTTLATAPVNSVYRGVALSPSAP